MTSVRLVGVLALMACSLATSPQVPGTDRLDAPIQYRTWYQEVETCSGLTGNYDALNLRTTRGAITMNDSTYSGYWEPTHTVVIQDTWIYNETLVKHEFMHDLLQRGDHPAQYFNGACGNLLIQ